MKLAKRILSIVTTACFLLTNISIADDRYPVKNTANTHTLAAQSIILKLRPVIDEIGPEYFSRLHGELAFAVQMALDGVRSEGGDAQYRSRLNMNAQLDEQAAKSESCGSLLEVIGRPSRRDSDGALELKVRVRVPSGWSWDYTVVFKGSRLMDMLDIANIELIPEPATTPLVAEHERLNANFTNFHGIKMPVTYGKNGIMDEHWAVRKAAGLFDISHMGVLEVEGSDARDFLQYIATNNIERLENDGDSQYSLLSDENGEIIDDIWVYRLAPDKYMLFVNACNTSKDFEHLKKYAKGRNLNIRNLRNAGDDSKVGIALQGRFADRVLQPLADFNLITLGRQKIRQCNLKVDGKNIPVLVSRTGYTGDRGFEIFVHPMQVSALWRELLKVGKPLGLKPCGLGCRDSLRIEAGMPLYGNEWQEGISPFELGFGWAVKFKKDSDFLGKEKLDEKKRKVKRKLVTLKFDKSRCPHENFEVYVEGKAESVGVVTSGTALPEFEQRIIMKKDKEPNKGDVVEKVKVGNTVALALVDLEYIEPGQKLKVRFPAHKRPDGTVTGKDAYVECRVVETPIHRLKETSPNYITHTKAEKQEMLEAIGIKDEKELFAVLSDELYDCYVRVCGLEGRNPLTKERFFRGDLDLPEALSQEGMIKLFQEMGLNNTDISELPSFLGAGHYRYLIPAIVDYVASHRGFYTTYTPYQAETSQGNLRVMYTYQSLVCRLTGMDVANASIYDGATALAEAMFMAHEIKKRKKVVVAGALNPSCLELLRTYAINSGLEIVTVPVSRAGMSTDIEALKREMGDDVACVILQQPNFLGELETAAEEIGKIAHDSGSLFVVHVNDPHTLASIRPPGEYGADIVTAEGQPFGNPLYFGGPGLGMMATKTEYVRRIPGRLVSKTKDTKGRDAFVLTLQTREQHIRREKATSNICSNEALCALRATVYALSLGDKGLVAAQERARELSARLTVMLGAIPGFTSLNTNYLGEVAFKIPMDPDDLNRELLKRGIMGGVNVSGYSDAVSGNAMLFSLTNANTEDDVDKLVDAVADIVSADAQVKAKIEALKKNTGYERASLGEMARQILPNIPAYTHDQLVKIFWTLAEMNFDMDKGMYPLGSCTMKYNPEADEQAVADSHYANLHPLQPAETVQPLLGLLYDFKAYLCEVLGMQDATLQPAAGAHGELTALFTFRAYHRDNSEGPRDVILAPDSSHGTNPASAARAGMTTVSVKSDNDGNTDMDDLKAKIAEYGNRIAGIMLTIPNTLGLFEPNIPEICRLIHDAGGLVYMDGANLNALVGQVRPGDFGIDAMHVNVHKTFSTPHGGGGPGAGPVGVCGKLAEYLPKPVIEREGTEGDYRYTLNYDRPKSIGMVLSTFGNVGVLLKAYAYALTIGKEGLVDVSSTAVLNANYILARIKHIEEFILGQAPGKHRMHEFVVQVDKGALKVRALEIAKKLLDMRFHAPTIYFPMIVHEAVMFEPTESESKSELDRFVAALTAIVEAARENPEYITMAPTTLPVTRVDEVLAARDPIVKTDDIKGFIDGILEIAAQAEGSAGETGPQPEAMIKAEDHNNDMALLNTSSRILTDYPVEAEIPLSLIPRSDLRANMRTWASIIALKNAHGLNINYIFESGDEAYRVEAEGMLMEELEALASKKGLDAEPLKARVNKRHGETGGRKVIRVRLMGLDDLKGLPEGALEGVIPVAMSDGKFADVGVPLRDFRAAIVVGLAQAACERVRRDNGSGLMEVIEEEMLPRLRDVYARVFPDENIKELITKETVFKMVAGELVTRKNLAIALALPPITRMLAENLRAYHERIQTLLQAA
ncbi:MAG: aminomethyl-transferring glycine dehydrogenase subunit GcvPB [Candidatus Omnitrophota bacterium]